VRVANWYGLSFHNHVFSRHVCVCVCVCVGNMTHSWTCAFNHACFGTKVCVTYVLAEHDPQLHMCPPLSSTRSHTDLIVQNACMRLQMEHDPQLHMCPPLSSMHSHTDLFVQNACVQLQMEHDPQLHMCFEGAAPRPWKDPEATAVTEEVFLESMRPLLNR